MTTRKLFIALLLTCLFVIPLGAVQPASAADDIGVVDQANTAYPYLHNSIQYYSPIGQSFTPMLPGLDVVELMTADFTYNNGYGAKLYVNIRESTIYGPILGTSNLLELPDNFSGVTHFTFPTLVHLTPGKLHVIEIVAEGGTAWIVYYNWGVGSQGGPISTYEGGTWILEGIEYPNNDLWFREGLASTMPLSAAYCKKSMWNYLVQANGSHFKSQGDCMRYVNTEK
jgi:hypothetical protein